MVTFVSEAFEELKKQVESLSLGEKSQSKFLMEGWCEMREAETEEKRAEREAAAKERRLQAKREAAAEEKRAEAEERKLLAEREEEKQKAAMELECLKLELEAKRLETATRPSEIAKEVVWRSARIARSPELPAFVNGRDDLDNYLLRFERYEPMLQLQAGKRRCGPPS